jgi:hypothetical protein
MQLQDIRPAATVIETFIFDLDGTLLNCQHQLSAMTVATLQHLQQQGARLVIATGRHINDVRGYLQQLGGDITAISCNGANIHAGNGELIYRQALATEWNLPLLTLGQQFAVHTSFYTDQHWLVSAENADLAAVQQHGPGYQLLDVGQLSALSALKVMFYGEHQLLQQLKQQIADQWPQQLHLTFSDPHYLEVMPAGCCKGHALQFLRQQQQFCLQQSIAFGDGMNDAELLALVGYPVLMANASQSLQQLLPQAARAPHHDQDGVAQFLAALGYSAELLR